MRQDFNSVPRFVVCIYGDWQSVISAKGYWDELIGQKPNDEEDANYSSYQVACLSVAAITEAYREFHERLKLRCELLCSVQSETLGVDCRIQTGDGYSPERAPSADIMLDPAVIHKAMLEAIQSTAKMLGQF